MVIKINLKKFTVQYFLFGMFTILLLLLYGTIGIQIYNLSELTIFHIIYLSVPIISLIIIYVIIIIGIFIHDIYLIWKDNLEFQYEILDYLTETIEKLDTYTTEELTERVNEISKRINIYYTIN